VRFATRLYRKFAHLIHELAAFGTIGVFNFIITIGISDTLHLGLHVGPLTSFGVGTIVATTFSYFANRFWTFRHRDKTGLGREYVLFFLFNGVGLVITWVFIGFTHYILGIRNGLAFNASQIIGTGVATVFRYWAYRKWVFLPPIAPAVDPHTGLPEAQEREGGAALPPPRVPPAGPLGGSADDTLTRPHHLVALPQEDRESGGPGPYEL
jgi:putative flippase GtrA